MIIITPHGEAVFDQRDADKLSRLYEATGSARVTLMMPPPKWTPPTDSGAPAVAVQ